MIDRTYDDLLRDGDHFYVPKFKLDDALAEVERLQRVITTLADLATNAIRSHQP